MALQQKMSYSCAQKSTHNTLKRCDVRPRAAYIKTVVSVTHLNRRGNQNCTGHESESCLLYLRSVAHIECAIPPDYMEEDEWTTSAALSTAVMIATLYRGPCVLAVINTGECRVEDVV